MREHVFGGWFSELDLPDWIVHCGMGWAWSAWSSILTDRELAEFNLPPVWVAVNVGVGDTHGDGLIVYLPSGGVVEVCRYVFGLSTSRSLFIYAL